MCDEVLPRHWLYKNQSCKHKVITIPIHYINGILQHVYAETPLASTAIYAVFAYQHSQTFIKPQRTRSRLSHRHHS